MEVFMTVILALTSAAGLVVIDQLLKVWAFNALPGQPSTLLIPHLLQLTYVENRGAAFGLFQGGVTVLSVLTGLILIGAVVFLVMGKLKHKLAIWSVSLIIAGGIGNLIDRIIRGFVVDYLDISPLFRFPVFNFADCCVVVGTTLLIVYLFFFDESAEKKQKKDGESIE